MSSPSLAAAQAGSGPPEPSLTEHSLPEIGDAFGGLEDGAMCIWRFKSGHHDAHYPGIKILKNYFWVFGANSHERGHIDALASSNHIDCLNGIQQSMLGIQHVKVKASQTKQFGDLWIIRRGEDAIGRLPCFQLSFRAIFLNEHFTSPDQLKIGRLELTNVSISLAR